MDTPRSERKRFISPEVERLLDNWRRWRVGDPDGRVLSEASIQSGLDPDRMDRAGSGMQRRYRLTSVPVIVRDAIAVEEAVAAIPREYADCLTLEYILKPEWTDQQRADHLNIGSRQTYYRRVDDAKIMVQSRIYGQRRAIEKERARLDKVDTGA